MSTIYLALILSLFSFGAITDCKIIGKENTLFFELKIVFEKYLHTILSDVTDYWPEVKQDLTKVIWSHATNSQNKLQKAFEGKL